MVLSPWQRMMQSRVAGRYPPPTIRYRPPHPPGSFRTDAPHRGETHSYDRLFSRDYDYYYNVNTADVQDLNVSVDAQRWHTVSEEVDQEIEAWDDFIKDLRRGKSNKD